MLLMRPISDDLRKRIIDFRQNGHSTLEVAERFGVSPRSVDRYWSRYQASGSYSSYKKGNRGASVLDAHKEELLGWIKAEPGLTLEQLRERLARELGVKISVPGLWYRLEAYGLSYKKKRYAQENKTVMMSN